jgi:hypothetical protein
MSRRSVETCWQLEKNDSNRTADRNRGYKRVIVAFEKRDVRIHEVVYSEREGRKGKAGTESGRQGEDI